MKSQIISMILNQLLALLTPDLLKRIVDKMLDEIEDYAVESSNTIDDKTVLPLCAMIRQSFDIPDNDE